MRSVLSWAANARYAGLWWAKMAFVKLTWAVFFLLLLNLAQPALAVNVLDIEALPSGTTYLAQRERLRARASDELPTVGVNISIGLVSFKDGGFSSAVDFFSTGDKAFY